MSECGSKGCDCTAISMAPPAPDTAGIDLERPHYQIDSMDYPTEEALVRNKLATLPGVVELEFNLA